MCFASKWKSSALTLATVLMSLMVCNSHGQSVDAAEPGFYPPFQTLKDNRTPIARGGVLDVGNRLVIPPQPREEGVSFRVGANVEYNDNVFFRDRGTQVESDLLYSVAPGIHVHSRGARHFTDIDLSFEAAEYKDNSDLSDTVSNASLLAFGSYEVNKTNRLNFIEHLRLSTDPSTQTIPAALSELERVKENLLQVSHTNAVRKSKNVRTEVTSFLTDFDGEDFVDSHQYDVELSLDNVGRKSAWGPAYRYRAFKFDGQSTQSTHAALWNADYQLRPNIVWQNKFGAIVGDEDETESSDVIVKTQAEFSGLKSNFQIGFERDFVTGGGLPSAFLSEAIEAQADWQTGASTSIKLSAKLNRLQPTQIEQGEIRIQNGKLGVDHFFNSRYLGRVVVQSLKQESPEFSSSARSNLATLSLISTF